ncbi:MAG: hypothetical protein ACETWB_08640 [Anaerolineae bacterium]
MVSDPQRREGSEIGDGPPVPALQIGIIGGVALLLLFVFIPLVIAFIRGHSWLSIGSVAWLVCPSASLLASWVDWLRGRRGRAAVDALVACGASLIWLFLVAADVGQSQGMDFGWWPFLIAGFVFLFTLVSFFALSRAVSAEGPVSSTSSGIRTFYFTLLGTSVVAMMLAYALALYFQVFK